MIDDDWLFFPLCIVVVGYLTNNVPEKALELAKIVPCEPDQALYVLIYNACGSVCNEEAIRYGEELFHRMPLKYHNDIIVMNSVLHMRMKCGHLTEAERLFSKLKRMDIITYGVMMNGYNLHHQPLKCIGLLKQMQQEKIELNEHIATLLVKACAQIGLIVTCQRILKEIPPNFYNNPRIASGLIDMWVSSLRDEIPGRSIIFIID